MAQKLILFQELEINLSFSFQICFQSPTCDHFSPINRCQGDEGRRQC